MIVFDNNIKSCTKSDIIAGALTETVKNYLFYSLLSTNKQTKILKELKRCVL